MTPLNKEIKKIITVALAEDLAKKDITSTLLFGPKQAMVSKIVAQEEGVLCGTELAKQTFQKMDPGCKMTVHAADGKAIFPNQTIMTISGKIVPLLAAERTALNFLQHLSGVATHTKRFAEKIKGTRAKIYDTRKTIPGMRTLQKYAVTCGGGENHRMHLNDMALVKDNHLKVGSEKWKVESLKNKLPKNTLLEIEAKNLDEVKLALNAKADIILLDNMAIPQLKSAIRFIRAYRLPLTRKKRGSPKAAAPAEGEARPKRHRSPLIEVSGGVTLKNVRNIALLGIDRISIGALTHSAPALDFSMDIYPTK